MQPPFLELAFYVGQHGVRGAFNSLSPPATSILGGELPVALAANVLAMVPANAFVEELEHGIYISTSAEFNPRGADVADRSEAQMFSTRVAREIGKAIV
jgi:hypothetical protein